MAQTGNFSPIQLYSSSTPGNAPAVGNLVNSTLGSELAINIADGKLFYKDSANAIQVIAWKTTPTTAGGTGLTSYTAGDMTYWASGTTFTKLGIGTSGYFMTSSGTAPQWTDPTTVAVTSISFGTTGLTPATATKGAITVAGTLGVGNGGTGQTSFTAGRVLFGNGTSGINSSSNLFWDNANASLGIGTSTPGLPLEIAASYSGGIGARITNTSQTNQYLSVLMSGNSTAVAGYDNSGVIEAVALGVGSGTRGLALSAYVGPVMIMSGGRLEVSRFFPSGGVSIGNTTDPGASNLSVTGGTLINSTAFAYTDNKLKVQGGTVFTQKTANVTTSATLVVSGVAGMFVIRDNNVGGTALVLLDAVTGVTIVSQQGLIFTTSTPLATQIQLGITSSPNYGMTALAGATRNGDQINIGSVICQ